MRVSTEVQGTYTQVNTLDIIKVVETELTNVGLTHYIKHSPKQKLITWRLPDVKIDDGDSILNGQIYLRNSMTPGVALTLYIGAYRFICSNGLVVGVGEGGKVIHRTGPKINNFVDTIPALIHNGVINLQDQLQETVEENTGITVRNPIDIVASLPIQHSIKESVIEHICNGTATENINNVWGLYNYVNEITRKKSRSTGSALEKDIGLLQHIQLLTLNQKAV